MTKVDKVIRVVGCLLMLLVLSSIIELKGDMVELRSDVDVVTENVDEAIKMVEMVKEGVIKEAVSGGIVEEKIPEIPGEDISVDKRVVIKNIEIQNYKQQRDELLLELVDGLTELGQVVDSNFTDYFQWYKEVMDIVVGIRRTINKVIVLQPPVEMMASHNKIIEGAIIIYDSFEKLMMGVETLNKELIQESAYMVSDGLELITQAREEG